MCKLLLHEIENEIIINITIYETTDRTYSIHYTHPTQPILIREKKEERWRKKLLSSVCVAPT